METNVLTAAGKQRRSTETSKGLGSQILYVGYALLALSLFIFAWKEDSPDSDEGNLFAIFFAHYLIALVFTGYLLFSRAIGVRRSWKKENIHFTIILLNLFLVSAYALNRVVVVFE